MARVTPAGTTAAIANTLARRARSKSISRKTRPYKVVLESVTQAKKKLNTAISFSTQPPPGYIFVPAGNWNLTEKCKEFCRLANLQVYNVSTSYRNASKVSQHVHRIGHHFPSSIVTRACNLLGLTLSRGGHVRKHARRNIRRYERFLKQADVPNREGSPDSISSQGQLNARAREAVIDLFPKIPVADREQIVSRAFRKGDGKVGTAANLSLQRRVQLATVAHVRHTYTEYDRLLHTIGWQGARIAVGDASVKKLVEWRGDDDDVEGVEEIFREVIVISDDEEDDGDESSDDDDDDVSLDREASVEYISSNPIVQLLSSDPAEDGRNGGDGYGRADRAYASVEDGSAPGDRPYPARARVALPSEPRTPARRDYGRYDAWEKLWNTRTRQGQQLSSVRQNLVRGDQGMVSSDRHDLSKALDHMRNPQRY
ncbi:MAG: hypothetical protein M1817_006132 [Caeruleum heppii]|nr:MAG: hypothetical protein M1817_006132 [Caeruleum heppii]